MLAVKHNAGHGVMFGMAKGNESRCDTTLCCEFMCWSGKDEKWLATRLFADVDIAPAHCLSNSRAERLRNSFFRRKPGSQMTRRKFHRHRILDLAIGKDTMKKPVAEAVDRMLNA